MNLPAGYVGRYVNFSAQNETYLNKCHFFSKYVSGKNETKSQKRLEKLHPRCLLFETYNTGFTRTPFPVPFVDRKVENPS